MSRPLRIGLLAEGEAELGKSVPYIKPEDGGKAIERSSEGGLHKLIRRELESIGITECEFTQRHPSTREAGLRTLRTGHSILDPKYLTQIVSVWQPEEVDLILIVVDADDVRAERESKLAKALATIQNNHIDADDKLVTDRSAGGLAIQNFETWLLADTDTVSRLLAVDLKTVADLENCADTKTMMESAIAKSTYLEGEGGNQRPLIVRWNLAHYLDLDVVRTQCPEGYGTFSKTLRSTARSSYKLI